MSKANAFTLFILGGVALMTRWRWKHGTSGLQTCFSACAQTLRSAAVWWMKLCARGRLTPPEKVAVSWCTAHGSRHAEREKITWCWSHESPEENSLSGQTCGRIKLIFVGLVLIMEKRKQKSGWWVTFLLLNRIWLLRVSVRERGRVLSSANGKWVFCGFEFPLQITRPLSLFYLHVYHLLKWVKHGILFLMSVFSGCWLNFSMKLSAIKSTSLQSSKLIWTYLKSCNHVWKVWLGPETPIMSEKIVVMSDKV